MMERALQIVWACVVFSGADAAHAQESREPKGTAHLELPLSEAINRAKASTDASPYFPAVDVRWCSDIQEPTTKKACWEAFSAGFNYYDRGLKHRSRVIEWQHLSSMVILAAVLLLVAAGMYFAWSQFRAGQRAGALVDDQRPQPTHIELSTSGFKVSSPVLGVVILAVSLAFFYLYLVYVYPIKEIF
jgi:hypothetical protein